MARSLYENGVNAVRQTEKQGIHQKGNRSFTIFSQKISTHLLTVLTISAIIHITNKTSTADRAKDPRGK